MNETSLTEKNKKQIKVRYRGYRSTQSLWYQKQNMINVFSSFSADKSVLLSYVCIHLLLQFICISDCYFPDVPDRTPSSCVALFPAYLIYPQRLSIPPSLSLISSSRSFHHLFHPSFARSVHHYLSSSSFHSAFRTAANSTKALLCSKVKESEAERAWIRLPSSDD